MAHRAPSRGTDSGFSSDYMPTPEASPKQGFANLVDNIDFGDEQRGLLDELDKLREHGVDKYVELPQIVVVGDQSSGKSSVLEAISELPFPRSSIRCTRFATQIKLRHSPETSLRVGIIPDPKRSPQERARLAQFPSTFPPNTPFGDIMDAATRAIIPDNKASFCSKDIFSIEISGPSKPHLTIVDLPGLIQAANQHQSQQDVDSIKELAFDYMRNQRTIILAIVSAASDLELQPVLAREARQFDPTGARTLGIITKPDKTETPEREAQFLELARNENINFKLGWHVLRNRAPNEMNTSSQERKRTEQQFFKSTAWNQLGAEKLGIETLRTRLSRELIKHIIHEMPMVQAEIRAKLDDVRRQLDQLGERGSTPDEMRDELRDLMEKSQALTRSAMEGQYVDLYGPAFFHPTPQSPMEAVRKLRARLVIQNESFAAEMSSLGHLVEMSDEPAGAPGGPGFADSHHPRRMTRAEFVKRHVEPLLEASPGLELRMDKNPLLVYTLFRNYSQNWPEIATRHLEEVQAICNDFLQEIIDFAWPVDMRPRAWNHFVEDKMEARLSEAHKEAGKLYKDRTRAAKPYDPEHTAKVMDWLSKQQQANPTSTLLSEFAPNVFLQKMLVYYELTCKTFVSNVIVQVIERHLVDELDRIFNVMRLQEFDDETIMEIAAEDPSIRQLRTELKNTRRTLEAGERICRKYTARRDLSLDFTPATAKAEKKSSARPYNPNGNSAPKQTRKAVAASAPAEPRTSYEDARPSYQREPAPPSVQRTPSRATVDSSISNPGNSDSYMPPGYAPPSRSSNRQSYVPDGYRNGNGAEEYYEATPHVPPRPPPTIPPKQPEVTTPDGEGFKSRQAMRNLFAGRK